MASGNKPAKDSVNPILSYNLPRHQGWNRIQKPAPDVIVMRSHLRDFRLIMETLIG